MGDEEAATLDGQFYEYSKLLDNKRSGKTITLYRSDFWMRQAKVLDDRKVTMTDTGILFNKYSKSEIDFDEWLEFLSDLCVLKELDEEKTQETLTNCGLPGQVPVVVPQYRDYFFTYKPKEKLAMLSVTGRIDRVPDGVKYCNAVFDSFLCWAPTPAGETAEQNCPPARLSDTSRLAFRICDETGKWVGRRPTESNPLGWTNYTPCFPLEVKNLFDKVSEDETAVQLKFEIAQRTRYLEIVGFSISLVALLISLFIFSYYRTLHNNRTKIHKSLFCAMVVQVVIRLAVYIDQFLVRHDSADGSGANSTTYHGIDNMPYLCEIFYALLEYAITVMFMWMFIEGLYLNNLITANVFREQMSYCTYFLLGWGLPLVVALVWATVTAMHYRQESVQKCWYGYNFLSIYWIVQGPRLAVVVINMVFLLNILKVLVVKLRRSENSEVNKIRKAVRAALVLLPLLGITNALDMTEAPLSGSVWKFALWSYTTHFLRSFQGFFIAFIYCFMNAEVHLVVRKHYANYKAMKETRRRHASLFRNNGRRPDQVRRVKTKTEGTQTKLPLRQMSWARTPNQPRTLADIQISMPSTDGKRTSTGTYVGPNLMGLRRSSCGAAMIHTTAATIENERRHREFYCRRSDPSTSYSNPDAETST